MAEFIDPFTDTGFKIIFGEENKESGILKEFLNDLFEGQPEFEHIEEIEYLNNERSKHHRADRTVIYDVYCKTQTGRRFIVEMQRQSQVHFISRAIYYVSRAIVDQNSFKNRKLFESWKYELCPVVGVFFCDFHVNGLENKLVHHIKLCDSDTGKPVSDLMCYTFIQLPVFNKTPEECTSEFDKWIYTLKNMPTMNSLPFTKRDVFSRLAHISNTAALSDDQLIQYEKDMKWALDYNSTIYSARVEGLAAGRAEGLAAGKAEGRAEGLAAGKAEGRAEGRAEGELVKATEIARAMLQAGMSTPQIASLTGLTLEQISRLS